MYEELIKSLRVCAIAERDYECAGCAYRDKDFDCNSVMKIEAADAIEELDTLLDGLEADNDALCETIERLNMWRNRHEHFNSRHGDAEELP